MGDYLDVEARTPGAIIDTNICIRQMLVNDLFGLVDD